MYLQPQGREDLRHLFLPTPVSQTFNTIVFPITNIELRTFKGNAQLLPWDTFNYGSVAVADESLTAFNDLKLGQKYKFILYGLNDAKTEIVVKETSTDASYDAFLEKLPENDCLYAVYDFEYQISESEGKRSKIVFITWSPDTAPIRSKMVYAASKDALRRALNGIYADVQGTDFSEVAYDVILEKVTKTAH